MRLEHRIDALEASRQSAENWKRPLFVRWAGTKEPKTAHYADYEWIRARDESEDAFYSRIEQELVSRGEPVPCVWINSLFAGRKLLGF